MTISITACSYSIAAASFLVLPAFLLTRWRHRAHAVALAVPCVLTAIWAMAIALHISYGIPSLLVTELFEMGKNAAWTAFLLILLTPARRAPVTVSFSITKAGAAIAALYCLQFIIILDYYSSSGHGRGPLSFLIAIVARLAAAVIGMLLVEQLYRNTPRIERWNTKLACLGIGGMFVYDIYLYSDAMLFRAVNAEIWAARGLVCALTVPLIFATAARNPRWSIGMVISRRLLFHSATLIGTAIYLLAMATAGYYLRFIGGSWGTIMQVTFLFGAILLLAVVMFSGAARSILKVFVSKHFFRYKYDYRDEWLRFTRTLSEGGTALSERTIQAIAELVESPGGTLFLARSEGYADPVAHWNMALARDPEKLDSSLCQFLDKKKWVIDLQEAKVHPERYGSISLPAWLCDATRAKLIVPLILHDSLFGFVVLAHPRTPVLQLNWEILDLLKIAGRQAASHIAQHEAMNALLVARQFESFNRMSTFVVHDLKNLVSQLSLLLTNTEKHKNNPEFQRDMIDTIDHSVRKMKFLLEKLSCGLDPEQHAPLLVDDVLKQAVASRSHFVPRPVLEIKDRGLAVRGDPSRLERVIGHLIQNAIEATAKDGQVVVRLAKQENSAVVELEDTGQGMSEEFIRDRLFKPFDSTKSAGMGIGVFESRAYIRELGGQLKVFSKQSIGTTFSLVLPLIEDESQTVAKFG